MGPVQPRICRELVISEATAKTHVAKILQKLGLRDRVQAVIHAYETDLVSPGPPPSTQPPPSPSHSLTQPPPEPTPPETHTNRNPWLWQRNDSFQ